MSLPRYPAYKDSGVEWIGSVPVNWEVGPLKRLLDLQNGADHKAIETDEGVPVIGSGGAFAFASMAMFDGESVLLGRKGTIDRPIYVNGPFWTVDTMYWSKVNPGVSAKFAYYAATTIPFGYYSTNTALPSMTKSALNAHAVACPAYDEQSAIAAFLDSETAKIDALIAEQERLLELLAEKRQAVISHAVTKGLNPVAPMKDSGVAWLGEVPSHWSILRIKHCIASIEQGWSPQCDGIPVESEAEWGVLKVGCVNGGVFRPEENKRLPDELEPLPYLALSEGDVLVSRANTRELVGGAAVVERSYGRLLLCDKLYRIRTNPKELLPSYLARWLGSDLARSRIQLDASGASSSMLNIGQAVILEMSLPVPPIEEQHQIVEQLRSATAAMERTQELAERSIALLHERRSALIAAAVTGQIDVREAA